MSFDAWAKALDEAQKAADLASVAAVPAGGRWHGCGKEVGTGLDVTVSGGSPQEVRDAAAGRAYAVKLALIWWALE